MTIIVKIEPTVRAGDHTSHFVAVFHFDGKNFVDSGKRLHVGVNGIPNQVGEEPLYSEGRAVLLVEGWSDGSMESGERCPDIIPLIDRYKKPDSKPVSGEVAAPLKFFDEEMISEVYINCSHTHGEMLRRLLKAAHHPAEDSKPQEVSVNELADNVRKAFSMWSSKDGEDSREYVEVKQALAWIAHNYPNTIIKKGQ